MSYTLDIPGPPDDLRDALPNYAAAVEDIAGKALALWTAYAQGALLPGGGRINARSGAYLKSIQSRQLGPFAWEIFSDSPYATAIERGMPARDLKKMLGSSWRVREVKAGPHKGQRYLIIPFRHGWPSANYNAMPQAIHDIAKVFAASHITGQYTIPTVPEGYSIKNQSRMTVTRNKYLWGDRLSQRDAESIVPTKPGHTTSIYSNMVRFDNPGGKHSHYMTFRMMGEWSSGWQAPPRLGLYPLRTVRDQIAPIAERAAQAALDVDLPHLVNNALRTLAA